MTGGIGHCGDALAEYAAGVLEGPERAAVRAHLSGCPACVADLAGWAAVAVAAGVPAGPPPAPAPVIRSALTRTALAPAARPGGARRARFAWQLLCAEARLVHPSVWIASVMVMACAFGVALVGGAGGGGAAMLSLVSPLVAVAGIAGVYGPRRDPAFEALAATVTSPRLVLLARVTLVFAYDLALAVAASALVHLAEPRLGLVDVVGAWLGPMALLSALSLLLSMWTGVTVATTVAASLWGLRVATITVPELTRGWLAAAMRVLWTTSPGTVAATLVLLAAAVWLSRSGVRPGGRSRPVIS
jgi:hypothetical protein